MMNDWEIVSRQAGPNPGLTGGDRPAATIPTDELAKLMIGIAEAFHTAAQGEVSTGYRALCDGLFKTRDCDDAWGPDLTQLWSLALAHFIKRHPASWFAPDA